MTDEEKLISLLQPKDYKSKIKLYCNSIGFYVQKHSDLFAQLKDNQYICKQEISPRIKIEEL